MRHPLRLLLLLPVACASPARPTADAIEPTVATFSIVARDEATGALGVAVQSRVLAVGSVVPFAEAGVGAVATQASANPRYGPLALAALRGGADAAAALDRALSTDEEPARARRQLGVIGASGPAAAFTGSGCQATALHESGADFTCQGNILAGKAVVEDMARAWRESAALPFPDRLLRALDAAQAAGGDKRGMQSAAIHVVRRDGGYAGLSDRFVDLRVDDHEQPIAELRRLYGIWSRTFFRWNLRQLLQEELAKDGPLSARALADLHLHLRCFDRLPERLGDARRGEFRDWLTARADAEGLPDGIRAELQADLAKLR
jgi:uncharacterized Ntn-hydrolase superfamily protein